MTHVRHWRIAFVVMHNRARLQGRKAAATDKLLVDNPIDRYKIGTDIKGLETAPDGSITIVISRDRPSSAETRAIGCPLLTAYSVCFCACTNRQKRFGTELGRCLRWSRSSSRRRRMSPYGIGRGSQGSRQNLSGKSATTLGSSPRAGFFGIMLY